MDVGISQEQEALRAQLNQAQAQLDRVVGDLRAVDGELEELETERRQYRLLQDACVALEELTELGGAGLFWGESAIAGNERVRLAWERVNGFEKRVGEIETRREGIVEEIDRWQEQIEIIEDDVFELQRREEERKREWLVEREISALPERAPVMPWSRRGEDDDRFRKTLALSLLIGLLFGLVFPQIELPLPEPWEPSEVPERLTRLIREERPVPPPPPPEPKSDEPKPTDETVPTEEPQPDAPKKNVKSKGILAFREKFSALAAINPSPKLGAEARITSSGDAAIGRSERSMVTTQEPGSSGGINLSALSREVGGGGTGDMEGVQVVRATSSIAGVAGSDRPLSDGPGLARTDEEIQIVFDRHKAALYRLYNRELRKNPTLKGQMVLRIRIEPDGSVSLCELQSSDMDAPGLAVQVVGRVKTFDFGAKEVPAITILYPIDFLPAT